MAARINIKNIDYFKFKKLVIDANRDDYGACSKEVKAFCDCVQTLHFRDEEFDDEHDRGRFAEICGYYKQILSSKRIDPIDMRIKSGWWGEHKNAYSAGKLKPAVLREKLILKTSDYNSRHGNAFTSTDEISEKIEGPGLYVFKHKEHQCFQYVGRADKILNRAADKLKAAFDGSSQEPLSALVIISMCNDWDFYFLPVDPTDGEDVLRILENDLILKHDSIWPHGLNFRLHIDSLLEVSEFRKSCLRHHWPPDTEEVDEDEIDIAHLRRGIEASAFEPICAPEPVLPKTTKSVAEKTKKGKETKKAVPVGLIKEIPEPAEIRAPTPPDLTLVDDVIDRPASPTMSTVSSSTFVVSDVTACTEMTLRPTKKAVTTPRPSSAGRRGGRGGAIPRGGKQPEKLARPTTPKSSRGKPTTRTTPKAPQSQNGNSELSPDDPSLSLTDDVIEEEVERTLSASSLSSGDSKQQQQPESPSKSAPKSPRQIPTATKKADSRLPVSAGGPSKR